MRGEEEEEGQKGLDVAVHRYHARIPPALPPASSFAAIAAAAGWV
jgi:hypothetical protein